jgi:long-chain fatty acid transport protein
MATASNIFADGGDFDIPETYGVGFALTPSPAFTLPLSADNGPGFGWREVSVWKIGAGYRINDAFTLHAGAITAKQPVQDTQTFFNILAPGVVDTHATLGVTWKLSAASELNVSYLHAFDQSVGGSGSIPPAFGGGEANLRLGENALGIAWSHHFAPD